MPYSEIENKLANKIQEINEDLAIASQKLHNQEKIQEQSLSLLKMYVQGNYSKIEAIKFYSAFTNCPLKDSKEWVEANEKVNKKLIEERESFDKEIKSFDDSRMQLIEDRLHYLEQRVKIGEL